MTSVSKAVRGAHIGSIIKKNRVKFKKHVSWRNAKIVTQFDYTCNIIVFIQVDKSSITKVRHGMTFLFLSPINFFSHRPRKHLLASKFLVSIYILVFIA